MTDNDTTIDDGGGSGQSRRAFLKASAGASALAIAGSTTLGSSSAAGIPTPRLRRANGNEIHDPSGNQVVLRGVNIPDPSRVNRQKVWRGKRAQDLIRYATNPDRGWNSHAIRLPCQEKDIERSGGLESFVNDHLDPAIQLCKQRGAYAIIDYHRITSWDGETVDQETRTFWDYVAPLYADDPHVIYEVFNEPTTPYGYGESITDVGLEHWNQWKSTAQPWVDLIKDHAPETLTLIGSPRWCQYTRFAAENEFEGDNLGYVFHCYTQFEGPGDCPRCWDYLFGDAADEVPMFITEWGYQNEGNTDHHMESTTSDFGQPFRNFLEEKGNIHWMAWCFDMNWKPIMFERPWSGGCLSIKPDYQPESPVEPCEWTLLGGENYEGEFVKGWLADKRDADLPAGEGGFETPTDTAEGTPTATDTPTATQTSGPSWPAGASDPDGDGHYEDLTGNGEIDNQDVVTFFQNMGTDANPGPMSQNGNLQYYDYSGNEQIDYQDLIALFGQL